MKNANELTGEGNARLNVTKFILYIPVKHTSTLYKVYIYIYIFTLRRALTDPLSFMMCNEK